MPTNEATHEQRTVPARALCCRLDQLEFGDNGEDAKTAPIRLVARAGKPIEHWYFGSVVHDFAGMRHKSKIPIDYVHSENDVIGYVNKFNSESGDLVLSGALVPFKDSDRATEIIFKNRAGVPYEASIDFRDSMVMEELKAGQFAEVNGGRVDGPATIIREWTLRGVAVCPYGADPNTSSQLSATETVTVSVKNKEQAMSEITKVEGASPVETTPEATPIETPVVTAAETLSEGKQFLAVFGQQGAVWFVEGKSFAEANALFAKEQTDRIAKLEAENAELQKRLAASESGEQSPVSFNAGEPVKRAGLASKIRFAGQPQQ